MTAIPGRKWTCGISGSPWSTGDTIEEAAVLLCRSGPIDDVRRKADELGLHYRSAPLPPPGPTRKITKAKVVELGEGRFGVAYEFDDGGRVMEPSESREEADFDARNRIGDAVPVLT